MKTRLVPLCMLLVLLSGPVFVSFGQQSVRQQIIRVEAPLIALTTKDERHRARADAAATSFKAYMNVTR